MTATPVKILVLYDSQTGNVEQMARLVAEGAREIQGVDVRLRKIEGEHDTKAAHGGGCVHAPMMAHRVRLGQSVFAPPRR